MVCRVYYVHWALIGRYITWLPGAQVKCWMLLTVYTLPQLAVSAKILCLLMVVICGAVPSMVRSVRLFSQCSHGYLRIYPNGTVMSKENEEPQNLSISSQDFNLTLLIYASEVRRYLCFTKRGKLLGKKVSKAGALGRRECQFLEEMRQGGYNTYRSVYNPTFYVGFNSRGTPLRHRERPLPARRKCINFQKIDYNFNINNHNALVAGDKPPPYPDRSSQQNRRLRDGSNIQREVAPAKNHLANNRENLPGHQKRVNQKNTIRCPPDTIKMRHSNNHNRHQRRKKDYDCDST